MFLWASENAVTGFKLHAVRHGRKRIPERPCASCSLSVAHSLICNFHLKYKKKIRYSPEVQHTKIPASICRLALRGTAVA